MKKFYAFIILCLMVAGLWTGLATHAPARVWLSQQLIELAWLRTQAGEEEAKPWPGMSAYPIAKMSIPSANKEHVILKGVTGEVMAFAPGWHDGTDDLGKPGVSLVSAHIDTHFSYLKDLKIGEDVMLETADGTELRYRIQDARVVQDSEIEIGDHDQGNILLLSTAYPFSNWQEGGVMRYVVIAKQENLVLSSL